MLTCWRLVSCALFEAIFAALKLERGPVHAIALPGRLRAVVEDMAEVAAAAIAMHFGASHEKTAVSLRFDCLVER